MQDKYGTQGFTVLAVTNETRALADTFVENESATYPIVIESTNSADLFGAGGFPSSFLIAPDGTIAWSGHPSAVPQDLLEKLLEQAVLFKDLPKKLGNVGHLIDKGKLGNAQKALTKHVESRKLSAEESSWAQKLQDWLKRNRESVTKRAAGAVDKGDFYTAWKAYRSMARDWKGEDFAKQAAVQAKELLADKAKKAEIDAGKRLDKIARRLGDLSPKKALKKLKPMTSRKYRDTAAGKRAASMIKGYERKLEAQRH